MALAADRVMLLQTELTRLTQYLHALPREAWRLPSACAQWQVQDVVAHLIGGAEFYTTTSSRGLQGDPSPPEGYPPAGTLNAEGAAEGMAHGAIVLRQSLGDQLLATFETTNDTLNRLLAGLGPEAWEQLCYHPGGLFPVRQLLDLRLGELVIHGWDIRSRFAPDVPLSPESVPVLLEGLAALTSGWSFWPGPQLAVPVRSRFAMTDALPGTTDIVVAGDTARIAEATDARADVTFHCAAEAYVLLRYGRLSLADALTTGRVAVEGDQALATAFGRWFKGI